MIVKLFAVKDLKGGIFNNLIQLPADGMAIRAFGGEINKAEKENPLYLYPSDFELWRLAEFDTNTGLISGAPERIAEGNLLAIRS